MWTMKPTTSGTRAQIPVIDISARNKKAGEQLLAAATNNGFVFVENNDAGIPYSDVDGMFDLVGEISREQ